MRNDIKCRSAFYVLLCINKKCAAEATHEKCISLIAATQLPIYYKYAKIEYAFLPKGKRIHTCNIHMVNIQLRRNFILPYQAEICKKKLL